MPACENAREWAFKSAHLDLWAIFYLPTYLFRLFVGYCLIQCTQIQEVTNKGQIA
jgi:hypothetical protein